MARVLTKPCGYRLPGILFGYRVVQVIRFPTDLFGYRILLAVWARFSIRCVYRPDLYTLGSVLESITRKKSRKLEGFADEPWEKNTSSFFLTATTLHWSDFFFFLWSTCCFVSFLLCWHVCSQTLLCQYDVYCLMIPVYEVCMKR